MVFDENAPINTNVWSNNVFNPPPGGIAAVLPATLAFKPAKMSSKQLVGTVSIYNKGKTTLTGVVGKPTSPFTLVRGVSGSGTFKLKPGKKLAVKIGMPLAHAGDFSGSLAILTSDPAHPQLTVPLSGAVTSRVR